MTLRIFIHMRNLRTVCGVLFENFAVKFGTSKFFTIFHKMESSFTEAELLFDVNIVI